MRTSTGVINGSRIAVSASLPEAMSDDMDSDSYPKLGILKQLLNLFRLK